MLLRFFRRNGDSRVPRTERNQPVSERPPAAAKLSSEPNQRMIIDIGRKLKRLERQFASHDGYVRENLATHLSIRELIEALQEQLKVIPSAKAVDLDEMKKITENHKRILVLLAQDPTTSYTYQEIADISRLTPNGVRGMVSQLSRMGYRFRKGRQGKKVTIQLIPSASSDQGLRQSASSA
jgi:DNA-binding MarR family transcriptional regulator